MSVLHGLREEEASQPEISPGRDGLSVKIKFSCYESAMPRRAIVSKIMLTFLSFKTALQIVQGWSGGFMVTGLSGSITISVSPALAFAFMLILPHGPRRLLEPQLSLMYSRKEDGRKGKGILHLTVSL